MSIYLTNIAVFYRPVMNGQFLLRPIQIQTFILSV